VGGVRNVRMKKCGGIFLSARKKESKKETNVYKAAAAATKAP
jgi:hypothetical protein